MCLSHDVFLDRTNNGFFIWDVLEQAWVLTFRNHTVVVLHAVQTSESTVPPDAYLCCPTLLVADPPREDSTYTVS